MSLYPANFPIAESIELVKLFRDGQVAAQKSLVAYDIWLVQGFVQKAALGDPGTPNAPSPEPAITPAAAPADFDPIDALDKVNIQFAAAGDGPTPQMTVPWLDILKWALSEMITILATA